MPAGEERDEQLAGDVFGPDHDAGDLRGHLAAEQLRLLRQLVRGGAGSAGALSAPGVDVEAKLMLVSSGQWAVGSGQ